jgi:hypothetical protein
MLWGALHFFIGLVEVIVAIALILTAGVTVAKIAFWILSRILGKLAGPIVESDPCKDEIAQCAIVLSPPDVTSTPSDEGR